MRDQVRRPTINISGAATGTQACHLEARQDGGCVTENPSHPGSFSRRRGCTRGIVLSYLTSPPPYFYRGCPLFPVFLAAARSPYPINRRGGRRRPTSR